MKPKTIYSECFGTGALFRFEVTQWPADSKFHDEYEVTIESGGNFASIKTDGTLDGARSAYVKTKADFLSRRN